MNEATLHLPEEGFEASTDSFSVDMSAGRHDLAVVTLNFAPNPRFLSGTPVMISYAAGTESAIFYGYIDTPVKTTPTRTGSQTVSYYVLGASSLMRTCNPSVWKSKTPFEIASDVVRRHGFGLEMDKVPGTLGFFAQSVESDWETLVKLATECGLVVTTKGALVRMVYPEASIRRSERAGLIPIPVGRNAAASTVFHYAETLTPVGYENYVFSGVDKYGTTFSASVNDDQWVRRISEEEVTTLAEAEAAADRVRRRGAAQLRATLTTAYHPSLIAGGSIMVAEEELTRTWYVLACSHASGQGSTGTSLSLCRVPVNVLGPLDSSVPPLSPDTVLVNGRWRLASSWEREL